MQHRDIKLIRHDAIPLRKGKSYPTSQIQSRKIVTEATGSQSCEVWEQVQESGGQVNRHYHDCEETVTFAIGSVEVFCGDKSVVLQAPSTVFIPEGQIHGFRNIGDEEVHLFAFFPRVNPKTIYLDSLE